MNNLRESKALYIVLSVLIACVLWVYVVSDVNTDGEDVVRNIPITITGVDVLDSRGLMITQQDIVDLDLRIVGRRSSLVKLTNENIVVTADASSIAEEGEYQLKCNITLPNTFTTGSPVTVNGRENYRVKVTVEKKMTKTVEVKGEFTGSVAEGYQAEAFILSPSSLEISGPASVLSKIDEARVTLNAKNLNTTYSGILPFEFITSDGSDIDLKQVECAASSIYVVYPVVMVREVELKVEFISGGGATDKNVTCEIEPSTIQISGKESDVEGVREIILGPIDLSKVGSSGTFTLPINLASELTNESGITEATVTVKITGLATKTLETDNIELINTPEGYHAEAVTQSLRVTVRGTQEAIDEVFSHQLRAVADLSDMSASEGQFRVPVKLYLDGTGDVGVVGGDYTISVTLSR